MKEVQVGSKFAIRLDGAYSVAARTTVLRNYKSPDAMIHDLHPWRRLAILFNRKWETHEDLLADFPGVDPTEVFDHINPDKHLFTLLPVGSTMNDAARFVGQRLQAMTTSWQPAMVRRRLQLVNTVHCDWMDKGSYPGPAELERVYKGHQDVSEKDLYGKTRVIAQINQDDYNVYRRGDRIFQPNPELLLHPIAEELCRAYHGDIGSVRPDFMKSGVNGLRVGILGWNSRYYSLGHLLAEYFALAPELYNNVSTGIYTDPFGRITNFYGVRLTTKEVCSPKVLLSLSNLVTRPDLDNAQIMSANKEVERFTKELGIGYSPQMGNPLAALFYGYLNLPETEWTQKWVPQVHQVSVPVAAGQLLYDMSQKNNEFSKECHQIGGILDVYDSFLRAQSHTS